MIPTLLFAAVAALLYDQRLDHALAKLAKGDPAAAGELIAIGPSSLPGIEPFLTNPKIEVRRSAVLALSGMTRESCRMLGLLLGDSSLEIRDRAALAIYGNCRRTSPQCNRLVTALQKPDPSAAVILLSGDCPETRALLQHLPPDGRVKLDAAGPVVPVSLVAAVARLRQGDAPQALVLAKAARSSVPAAEFLVQALPAIPDAHLNVLQQPLLTDARPTRHFTNAPVGARPPRQIRDAALEAFAKRLGLSLLFAVPRTDRYSDQEMRTGTAAIAAALTRLNR